MYGKWMEANNCCSRVWAYHDICMPLASRTGAALVKLVIHNHGSPCVYTGGRVIGWSWNRTTQDST